jgi:hypothetical protein
VKTIEFFSGTKSFSKVMEKHGHDTLTVDNDPLLKPDLLRDIMLLPDDFLKFVDITCFHISMVWFSPPCQAFSVATIGRNWKDGKPISQKAEGGIALLRKSIRLIVNANHKTVWFIENPRGMMRTIFNKVAEEEGLKNYYHHEITYCQYGDDRMKPTDLWTNAKWFKSRPVCGNGMSCHQAAPRGSKTGTQGLKGATARGAIPPTLFEDILKQACFSKGA